LVLFKKVGPLSSSIWMLKVCLALNNDGIG
jgi:hypothetical protein